MDSSRRPKRSLGQWNAYVVLGADREERRRRLEEVPKRWRKKVENHVRTYFAITRSKHEKARDD